MSCAASLLVLSMVSLGLGAVWEGEVSTAENFVFLERFAFAETPANTSDGVWTFQVNASRIVDEQVGEQDVQIDLYFDSDSLNGGWFAVWGNDTMTCQQKRDASAKNRVRDNRAKNPFFFFFPSSLSSDSAFASSTKLWIPT